MIGDVVGEPGLAILEQKLPGLIAEHNADLALVNGENAAAGFGLNEECLRRILGAGADVVTTGNHVWEKREFWPFLDKEERVLRPANYPQGNPGRGWIRLEKAGVSYLVINLQGREYMTPIDCPFTTFNSIVESQWTGNSDRHPPCSAFGNTPAPDEGNCPALFCRALALVDFHAESTREKEALGYYLDGKVSMMAGTHTHVQTADERVLPKGTGYITDLGMTGISNGVIGMDKTICLDRARNQVLYRMECAAEGTPAVEGVLAELDRDSGRALNLRRIRSFAG
ncbi:MAG: YmdB family metallophosphoesterase [Treponema sp.]|jgi:calcineurin-like phosphoesterase|nr:YmdB family metallophosphoesterase [Treponema sp.]